MTAILTQLTLALSFVMLRTCCNGSTVIAQ